MTTASLHSPWWALLLVLVILGLLVAIRKPPATLLVSQGAVFRHAGASLSWRHPVHVPLLVQGLGLLLLVFALMRPQEGIEKIIRRSEGIDIMLALDVSGSMQAYDFPLSITSESELIDAIRVGRLPNRISIAQQELENFVQNRPHDRIGLIAFAKLPYVVCPPTLDHAFLLENLKLVEAGKLPDGTGIAGPVAAGTSRLRGSSAKRRVLVLFTDGDNNVEAPVTPEQAAKTARTFNVVVYTVGVGSDRAALRVGRGLRVGVAGFNQELLRSIAETTGGKYFEARDAESFHAVMKEIDELETISIEQPVYRDYRERFVPWLVAGAALLVAGFVLEKTWFQKVP